MASTNTTPESKNKSWGYYCTINHHGDAEIAWPIAINTISDATQLPAETVATFLDSRHGRHFADKVSDDLSPENILRQAANLKDLYSGILFPGILINTSPTHLRPIRQMQLTRWTGEFWQVFGDQIEAA